MFHNWSDELIQAMSHDKVGIHAHTYAIGLDTFEKTPGLKSFMRLLQSDAGPNEDGKPTKFVNAMEAKSYPVFTTMYHPEY